MADLRMPIPGTLTPTDPDYYTQQAGDNLNTTMGQNFGAAFYSSMSPLKYGLEAINQESLHNQDQPLLDPPELNAMFKDMDKPFQKPTSLVEANYMNELAQERKRQQTILEHGPSGGWASAVRFGAGMIPQALDPINAVGGAVIGMGMKAAGVLQGAGVLSEVARTGAENVIANTASEAIVYPQAQRENQNYTLGDSAENILYGAAGGTALHFAIKGVASAFGRGRARVSEFMGRNEKAVEVTENVAKSQFVSDKQVDIHPIVEDQIHETSGVTRSGAGVPYEMKAYEHSADRTYYAGTERNDAPSFSAAEKSVMDENLGSNLIYASDNPNAANGVAARKLSPQDGKVYSLNLKENLNLINLDEKMPTEGPVYETLKNYLDEIDSEKSKDISVKEAIQEIQNGIVHGVIPEAALEDIGKSLHEKGFDGYRHEGGSMLGVEAPKQNVVAIFDPDHTGDAGGKIQETGSTNASRDIVSAPTSDQAKSIAQDQLSSEKSISFDQKSYDAIQEAMNKPSLPDRDMGLLKKQIAMQDEAFKTLSENGMLNPEEQAHLDAINEAMKKGDVEERAMKALIFCEGRN